MVTQITSAVPDWLQVLAAVGTTVGAVFGAVAAFAAVGAARAALAQAKQSTEAANRSLEALGRALAPEGLLVTGWLGRQPIGDYTETTSPTLLRVQVMNPRGPAAAAVTVSVTSPGDRPRPLTPIRRVVVADERAWFHLDDFVCVTADHEVDKSAPSGERQAAAEHLIAVEYSDLRELLRWRQVFRVEEVLYAAYRQEGYTSYPDLVASRVLTGTTAEPPELISPPG